MKTFLLPVGFGILETSSVKCVLCPMKTLQIHQSVVSPARLPPWYVGTLLIQESQNKQGLDSIWKVLNQINLVVQLQTPKDKEICQVLLLKSGSPGYRKRRSPKPLPLCSFTSLTAIPCMNISSSNPND